MALANKPFFPVLCRTFQNSIQDVRCPSQGRIFLREICNQLLMVCDYRPFPKRCAHNAEKSDRKGGETTVQILDFKEALWHQLTYASIH